MNAWILVIGDLLMLLLFAWLGQAEHQTTSTFLRLLEVAAPFAIAWLLVGGLRGLFQIRHYRNYSSMLKGTAQIWIAAIPLGTVLRAWYNGSGIVQVSFLLVGLISTFVLLVAWRTLFVWLNRKRQA